MSRGFVETERCLREISDARRVGQLQRVHIFDALHQNRLPRRFAQRARHFIVILVADQNDGVAGACELDRLDVNLGDQRTGRIDHVQVTFLSLDANRRRDSMRTEDGARAFRHFVQLFDKDGAGFAQFFDHVLVVHDFFAHIHGGAIQIERNLNDVDGAHDARAKAARLQQVELFFLTVVDGYRL